MKKLLFVFTLIVSFLFSTSIYSQVTVSKETRNSLRNEVMNLLNISKLKNIKMRNETIIIYFIVSPSNEFLVTSVNTKNSFIEEYCKNNLNYNQIQTKGIDKTQNYTIRLKFENYSKAKQNKNILL